MISVSPSACTSSLSLGTPGRSAYSVMPESSSMTSTGGSSAGCSMAVWSRSRPTAVCSFMSSPRSIDVNAARLGRFQPLDAHVQDALAVGRTHLVRVQVVGKRDHAVKAPGEALVYVHARPLALGGKRRLALAGDAQHPALELDVEALRLQPRGERINLHRLRRARHVERGEAAAREAPDTGRKFKRSLDLTLQAVELREKVAGKKREFHGPVLHKDRSGRKYERSRGFQGA